MNSASSAPSGVTSISQSAPVVGVVPSSRACPPWSGWNGTWSVFAPYPVSCLSVSVPPVPPSVHLWCLRRPYVSWSRPLFLPLPVALCFLPSDSSALSKPPAFSAPCSFPSAFSAARVPYSSVWLAAFSATPPRTAPSSHALLAHST
eukprot:1384670-Pleurochrysis_carterae.AAC.1